MSRLLGVIAETVATLSAQTFLAAFYYLPRGKLLFISEAAGRRGTAQRWLPRY